MSSDASAPAPSRPGGAKNVSSLLTIVALVLALAALGAGVAIPGPAGPQGATGATGANGQNGATGPAGPGALMASFWTAATTTLSTGCTNATSVAQLKVPSKGNVTITASVSFEVSHTSGTDDGVLVYASTSRYGGCSDSAGYAVVPAAQPTAVYVVTVPVSIVSPVAVAGTYSFTVGAVASSNVAMTLASGYAVFYPG